VQSGSLPTFHRCLLPPSSGRWVPKLKWFCATLTVIGG
jgi:hypothetical protein